MAFTLLDSNGAVQTFASTLIDNIHYPSHQVYPQVAGGGLIPYRNLNLQPAGGGETTVYENFPDPFPYSMTSQNFEAGSMVEFGQLVSLADDTRRLATVTVTMITWAYFTKYNPAKTARVGMQTDVAKPLDQTTGWNANITLNIYAVDSSGVNPEPGTKVATLTQTVLVPWRAEPDTTNCPSTTKWLAPDGCHNGLAFPVTFDFTGQNITMPDQCIFGIAFTTQSSGAPAGPINDLAVGVQNALVTGSLPLAPQVYVNGYNNGAYADGGAGGLNVFRLDVGSDSPAIGIRIVATAPAGPNSLIKTGPGQVYGWHCSNHSSGTGGGWRYIKLYDKATNPTEGDTPILTLGVPPGAAISFNSDLGIQYMKGLGIRGTVNMADSDKTPPNPGDLLVNIHFI